jgi:hypothetical protein
LRREYNFRKLSQRRTVALPGGRLRALALGLSAVLAAGSLACSKTHIDSLDRQRGAPGEEFTINGTNLDNFGSPPAVPPRLTRCGEFTLEVVQWFADSVRVRIPRGVPPGSYGVFAFGPPLGAYQRARTNTLPFWVTAAPVPDAVTDAYEVQVRSFGSSFGKSDEWVAWMLANRDRYQPVFVAAHALPCPLPIAVSYQAPLAYNPPWSSESAHMTALDQFAEPAYPGYHFDFRFGVDPASCYAHAILGIPTNLSHASGRDIYLYYETIFNHEFGHVLNLLHHYDTDAAIGTGQHFPPGERYCIMDRNSQQFCSACRTALNVALDVDNGSAIDAAGSAILARYPPK